MGETEYRSTLFTARVENGELVVSYHFLPITKDGQKDGLLNLNRADARDLRKILDAYLAGEIPAGWNVFAERFGVDYSLDLLIRHNQVGWAVLGTAYALTRFPDRIIDRQRSTRLFHEALGTFFREGYKYVDPVRRDMLAGYGDLRDAAKARLKSEYEKQQKEEDYDGHES